jgi:hypothetical protein
MKKLLFTFLLACTSAVGSLAQDTTSVATPNPPANDQNDKDKQQIAISELPEAIRALLTREDYIGWTVTNAFRKKKGGRIIYFVEVNRGIETRQVKFDAEGNNLNANNKDKRNQ